MRALGASATTPAVQALTEQLKFYGKGEGALVRARRARHIADPSSVPLFKTRPGRQGSVPAPRRGEGLARAATTSKLPALEIGAGNDTSEMVRAAMAFALQKLGATTCPGCRLHDIGKVAPADRRLPARARSLDRRRRWCRICRIRARPSAPTWRRSSGARQSGSGHPRCSRVTQDKDHAGRATAATRARRSNEVCRRP